MVRERTSHQWLSKIENNREDLAGIVKEADDVCYRCNPISPMICVEHCEVWRTKKEFLEMNGKLCTDDYFTDLLNAVKNDRRQEVLSALSERPLTIEKLQHQMKENGFHHSRSTIADSYVKPLMDTGLVKEQSDKYRLTLYGRKFQELLKEFDVEDSLPPQSSCYEEILLRALKDGPMTYDELGKLIPKNVVSRALQRLTEENLVSKSRSPYYIFYFRTKRVPEKSFSPTEKKIYEAIPELGTSAPELSKKADITLRRTYKYLRRLRRRRLVFTRESPRTYELTPSGRDAANFVEETVNLVSEASRASTFLLERSKQTMATPEPQ